MGRRAVPCLFALVVLLAGCMNAGVEVPGAVHLSCEDPCWSTLDSAGAGYAWEPHVAVDPADPSHIATTWTLFDANPNGGTIHDIIVVSSTDDGETWSRYVVPHATMVPPDHPLAGSTWLGDPFLAWSPDHTLMLVGLGLSGQFTPAANVAADFLVFTTRSTDGGATFDTPSIVVASRSVATQSALGERGIANGMPDYPRALALSDGGFVVTWRELVDQADGTQQRSAIRWSASGDRGLTWSTPRSVDPAVRDATVSDARTTNSGAWVWSIATWDTTVNGDAFSGPFGTVVARSVDRGESWEFMDLGEGGFGAGFAPTRDGLALVTPPAASDSGSALVRFSRDDGVTWGAPRALTGANASMPTTTGDGTLGYVSFWTRDAGGSAVRALAFDGTRTSEPVTLRKDLAHGGIEVGEYFGLAPTGDGAFAVWTTDEGPGSLEGARLRAG